MRLREFGAWGLNEIYTAFCLRSGYNNKPYSLYCWELAEVVLLNIISVRGKGFRTSRKREFISYIFFSTTKKKNHTKLCKQKKKKKKKNKKCNLTGFIITLCLSPLMPISKSHFGFQDQK